MIRLKEHGGRGEDLTITLDPFDLMYLVLGLETACMHGRSRKLENPKSWEILGLQGMLDGYEWTFKQIEAVQTQRNAELKEKEVEVGR